MALHAPSNASVSPTSTSPVGPLIPVKANIPSPTAVGVAKDGPVAAPVVATKESLLVNDCVVEAPETLTMFIAYAWLVLVEVVAVTVIEPAVVTLVHSMFSMEAPDATCCHV